MRHGLRAQARASASVTTVGNLYEGHGCLPGPRTRDRRGATRGRPGESLAVTSLWPSGNGYESYDPAVWYDPNDLDVAGNEVVILRVSGGGRFSDSSHRFVTDASRGRKAATERSAAMWLLLLAILVAVFLGLGFVVKWLFVAAVVAALVWVIAFFFGSARRA